MLIHPFSLSFYLFPLANLVLMALFLAQALGT